LFDFGLAKELDETRRSCSEYYEMSGNCGSIRYMAPECALSEPYNLSVDVYSLGLLAWEICALEVPFDGMKRRDHLNRVIHGHERPPLDPSWPLNIRLLLKRSWEPNPSVRPSSEIFYNKLCAEIEVLSSEQGSVVPSSKEHADDEKYLPFSNSRLFRGLSSHRRGTAPQAA
jgi:serine/threonine protein kinase